MIPHRSVDLGTIRIPEGETDSDSMDFRGWRGSAQSVSIQGPPDQTLTGTARVQTSEDEVNWFDLQSAGSDITVPADGKAVILSVDFKWMRVKSNSAEADPRVFTVKGEEGR